MFGADMELNLEQNAVGVFLDFLRIVFIESSDDASYPLNFLMLLLFFYVVWVFISTKSSLVIRNSMERFVFSNAPSLLINTGLTGTFFGISVSLLGFDVESIEDSIPRMIEGMRFAFLTSFVGVFLALLSTGLIKYRQSQFSAGDPDDDFADVRAIQTLETSMEACLGRIERALIGKSPGSLINVAEKIEQSANSNASRIQEKIEKINEYLEEERKWRDGNVDLKGVLSEINLILVSLREQQELSSKQVAEVNSRIEEVISSASEKMVNQFQSINEAAYSGLSNSVDKQVADVTETLASGLEQVIEKFISDMHRLMDTLKYEETLDEAAEK